MFAYTRNLQLALTDRLRGAGLLAGAGVAVLVGLGFLLAALWTWLAWHLHWGPLGASLAIGLGFVLVALALVLLAGKQRHPVPTTDELKAEVAQHLGLAADAAVDKALLAADRVMERASDKATQFVDRTGQRVQGLADDLSYRADRLAERAEARAYGTARRAGEAAADQLGLGRLGLGAGPSGRPDAGDEPRPTAVIAPLIGAFAIGLTLASRLRDRRQRDEDGGDDPHDA